MYQASFSGFLQTIMIILLVYFALKIFIKWFGPRILRYFVKKMGEKAMRSFNQSSPFSSEKKKEPEPEIKRKQPNTSKTKKDVGEYIDYEEIE